jgi:hypothetical protein
MALHTSVQPAAIGDNRSLTVAAQIRRFRAARANKRYAGHHTSLALVFAGVAASAFGAPAVSRNTAPGTRYVGSKVCSACHPRIYSSYVKTAMGRSMLPGTDKSLRERIPAPFTIFDPDAGQYFQVFRKDEALYQTQYAVDADGRELFRQTWPLAFVVGSGENGFGFAIERDGHLFEAPLSYYTRTGRWGFSPGYELRNYGFSRPVLEECIVCHSGRPQPVPGRVAAYRDPPFTELAVGCENCHGPGELHVAERQTGRAPAGGVDNNIVNPDRLTGWLADNICMKCHEGGDVRVEQPGKQALDFRPGTPLQNAVAIFKVPLTRESPPSVLLEHYFSMSLSECYRASAGRLRCTSCHDPHTQPSGPSAAEFYKTRCLECHRPENCKLSTGERLQKSPADDCVSCHMPKRVVTTITHAALTDHRITARPSEPYPEQATESRAFGGSGLLCLTAAPGDKPGSVPPVALLAAYAALIAGGHNEFISRRDELLDRLGRGNSGDSAVLAALARRASAKNTREGLAAAIGYLARALQAGTGAPGDLLLLANLYSQDNRHADAIRVLEKGWAANPYFREFSEQIAAQQIALGQYEEALRVLRKGLERFPDDITLRLLDKKVRAAILPE